jgi:hypothetical protein
MGSMPAVRADLVFMDFPGAMADIAGIVGFEPSEVVTKGSPIDGEPDERGVVLPSHDLWFYDLEIRAGGFRECVHLAVAKLLPYAQGIGEVSRQCYAELSIYGLDDASGRRELRLDAYSIQQLALMGVHLQVAVNITDSATRPVDRGLAPVTDLRSRLRVVPPSRARVEALGS